LHCKSYPLKGKLLTAYGEQYMRCKKELESIAKA